MRIRLRLPSPSNPKDIDVLGKLTIDALPFYSSVALVGALVTVFGALGVAALITWLGQWRYLWTE
jgi:cytochrome o ubiquinol oxidase subunit I